jgi:hypothetical protein
MGWDGMGWDGMGWDGMGWDACTTLTGVLQDAHRTQQLRHAIVSCTTVTAASRHRHATAPRGATAEPRRQRRTEHRQLVDVVECSERHGICSSRRRWKSLAAVRRPYVRSYDLQPHQQPHSHHREARRQHLAAQHTELRVHTNLRSLVEEHLLATIHRMVAETCMFTITNRAHDTAQHA